MQDAILAEDRDAVGGLRDLPVALQASTGCSARVNMRCTWWRSRGAAIATPRTSLEIRLENPKMVIFRARRKIHRAAPHRGLPHVPARSLERRARPRTATAQNHPDPTGLEDAS